MIHQSNEMDNSLLRHSRVSPERVKDGAAPKMGKNLKPRRNGSGYTFYLNWVGPVHTMDGCNYNIDETGCHH
jgi:hypothetical protein